MFIVGRIFVYVGIFSMLVFRFLDETFFFQLSLVGCHQQITAKLLHFAPA